ncbi:hypothetical protein [Actinoplanes regularis]|uniref:hypothetical protein n=1 Tax=Actinoplanes regularis TaxID=52697 RepID=UPI0024A37B22|nr:hypothetical protein [Actinoplanes regularis]GLW32360.1 hypothetical protein Areg01_52990 [Actinoplanes regularis]
MSDNGNPYPEQTATNARAPWLDGGPPLDVKLEGLRKYAKHMSDQQVDLVTRGTHLGRLTQMPMDAWSSDVLGEAAAVKAQVLANASELFAYLEMLGKTLHNVGSAAQTIADSYGTGDAMSAASLNDVLFAFGDKSVPRPSGLPKGLGETYWDQQANAKAAPLDAASGLWTDGETRQVSPIQTVQTSFGPNGEKREVRITNVPGGGGTITTTTVYDAKGHVVTTSSSRVTTYFNGDTQTTTEESYDAKGNKTGSTRTTTTYTSTGEVGHEVTETRDAKDVTTNRKTTDLDESSKVVTETSEKSVKDKDGDGTHFEPTDRVTVGRQTEGQEGVSDTIAGKYDPYRDEVPG